MTVTARSAGGITPAGHVSLSIDGFSVTVPEGTLIIRAAELLGIQIPRFCDHPLLDPVGACRQCIVEIEGQRKPVTACTTTCSQDLVVKTQLTSSLAAKAQAGTMELLLINHPLDCPVCDKGGECPLQNQAMTSGRADSRFLETKRTYPKPIAISSQVLLDRERCVLCARCTRFSLQIAGDPFIELFERGALEQVAIYEDEPFRSYFSGNTIQICPVGALTGAAYRFRARPFDLVSTPSVCEHCSSGCQLRTDWRRGRVLRRLAGEDPEVNEQWNCDKGRWAFRYATAADRLSRPAVRDSDGFLVDAAWSTALRTAAEALRAAKGKTGVLTGGRLTVEDAYAYAKFARLVCATNDIDFRARPHSAEEIAFLAAEVAGRYLTVTYADLQAAPAVLLAGFEPEEESPIVFLRLRKAARSADLRVYSVAPFTTPGLRKLSGRLLRTVPGDERAALDALAEGDGGPVGLDLRKPGSLILVGERLAEVPGALSAARRLAAATGARLAWIPRRAGERAALEAGAAPGLLPAGRPLAEAAARAEIAELWGAPVPEQTGRSFAEIIAAARSGDLDALIIAGVDASDAPDPAAFADALAAVPFVLSLELRESFVTARADVVLPVAPVLEKSGSFLDWEGRLRPFETTLEATGARSDREVLDALAHAAGLTLGLGRLENAQAELRSLSPYADRRPAGPDVMVGEAARPSAGEAVLATWHLLLDEGRLQDEEPFLAGTRQPSIALLAPETAARLGLAAGEELLIAGPAGEVRLPLGLADLPVDVVWLPTNSPGSHVRRDLGAGYGQLVRLSRSHSS
ncbi:MAG: NADH-quinone oxidoreductase subunit G [Mycobacteriales bacterium]